jgi:hypothetical protein
LSPPPRRRTSAAGRRGHASASPDNPGDAAGGQARAGRPSRSPGSYAQQRDQQRQAGTGLAELIAALSSRVEECEAKQRRLLGAQLAAVCRSGDGGPAVDPTPAEGSSGEGRGARGVEGLRAAVASTCAHVERLQAALLSLHGTHQRCAGGSWRAAAPAGIPRLEQFQALALRELRRRLARLEERAASCSAWHHAVAAAGGGVALRSGWQPPATSKRHSEGLRISRGPSDGDATPTASGMAVVRVEHQPGQQTGAAPAPALNPAAGLIAVGPDGHAHSYAQRHNFRRQRLKTAPAAGTASAGSGPACPAIPLAACGAAHAAPLPVACVAPPTAEAAAPATSVAGLQSAHGWAAAAAASVTRRQLSLPAGFGRQPQPNRVPRTTT